MFQDLDRYAKRYGVPLKFNPHFPINTLMLMRAVTGIQLRQPERFQAFIDCLFTGALGRWPQPRRPATVAAVLSEHGFDPHEVLALTNDEAVKAAFKENTETAVNAACSVRRACYRQSVVLRPGSARLRRRGIAPV